MKLETERLSIRPWQMSDDEPLFAIIGDPDVMFHIGDRKPYRTIEDVRSWLEWSIRYNKENGFGRWAVVRKITGELIGSCGLLRQSNGEIELGYLFRKDQWGKGFATEAAAAVLNYAFDTLSLVEIVAWTDVDHFESHHVLEKIGFVQRGLEEHDGEIDLVFAAHQVSSVQAVPQ